MTNMTEGRLLLRVTEAADMLGISRSRAYELVNSGALPAIRLGKSVRIPLEALQDWIRTAASANTSQQPR